MVSSDIFYPLNSNFFFFFLGNLVMDRVDFFFCALSAMVVIVISLAAYYLHSKLCARVQMHTLALVNTPRPAPLIVDWYPHCPTRRTKTENNSGLRGPTKT